MTNHSPRARYRWPSRRISRRGLLKGAGGAALTGMLGIFASCGPLFDEDDDDGFGGIVGTPLPNSDQYPEVPMTPNAIPERSALHAFSFDQARTVEALTARIMPGSADDPGAREAGVVAYIDSVLNFNSGFVEPTYFQAPFARAFEGDSPPDDAEQEEVIWVAKDQLERYGFQSQLTPREMYRVALIMLDTYCQREFDSAFVDLTEEQQDQVVGALADGTVDTFNEPSAKDFFKLVRQHTIEGFFGDPVYGGNRDMVGWKLINYPGAQRAYTPQELMTEGAGLRRRPQSIVDMQHFHAGEPVDGVDSPVSGAGETGLIQLEPLRRPASAREEWRNGDSQKS